jgi:hypothetical protein
VVPSSNSDNDLLLARHTTRVDLNSSGARICYSQELSNVRERKEKKKKKKKKELGLKSKRGETSDEKLHVSKGGKKKGDEISKLLGEILLKESKKGDHIFLWCKIRYVASSIPTYHLHLHYLKSLDFSLS